MAYTGRTTISVNCHVAAWHSFHNLEVKRLIKYIVSSNCRSVEFSVSFERILLWNVHCVGSSQRRCDTELLPTLLTLCVRIHWSTLVSITNSQKLPLNWVVRIYVILPESNVIHIRPSHVCILLLFHFKSWYFVHICWFPRDKINHSCPVPHRFK